MLFSRNHAVFAENENFTRLNITDYLTAHRFNGTAFRGYNIHSVRGFAVTKGAETVWVSGTYKFLGRHQHKRICSVKDIHSTADSVFNGSGFKPLLSYDICNGFGIAGGVENSTRQFKFIAKFCRIGKISVVCQSHSALLVVYFNRLAVISVGSSRCAVACMGYRHPTFRKS